MINLDSEQYVKEAICQWLNDNPQGDFPAIRMDNVVALRIIDTDIIALIDCGIKGVPKFVIPAEKLEFKPKPVPEPQPKKPATRRKRSAKK
jgi:hypothetical protein